MNFDILKWFSLFLVAGSLVTKLNLCVLLHQNIVEELNCHIYCNASVSQCYLYVSSACESIHTFVETNSSPYNFTKLEWLQNNCFKNFLSLQAYTQNHDDPVSIATRPRAAQPSNRGYIFDSQWIISSESVQTSYRAHC